MAVEQTIKKNLTIEKCLCTYYLVSHCKFVCETEFKKKAIGFECLFQLLYSGSFFSLYHKMKISYFYREKWIF